MSFLDLLTVRALEVLNPNFSHMEHGTLPNEHPEVEFDLGISKTIDLHANKKNYLEIYSDNIENPVFVRYAWSDTSTASLFNSEGLPASSFSTQN